MTEASILKKERLQIGVLAGIQFTHILDFVIMMPLGPIIMRAFAITPGTFSSLVGSYNLSAGVAGLIASFFIDEVDRKKLCLWTFAGLLIGTLLCALATTTSMLLAARIVAGCFGGVLNATVLALVVDVVPGERRGRALGAVMSAFSLASIVGVPIALMIADSFQWHAAFIFVCLFGMILWVLSYTVLPSVPPLTEKRAFSERLANFRTVLLNRQYQKCFLFMMTGTAAFFMIIPFLSPYMTRNVGLPENKLSLIYLFGGATTIVVARLVGRASDRFGALPVFRFMLITSLFPIFAVTRLPVVPLWMILVATSCFMAMASGRFIPGMAMVTSFVSPKERGTFMALENSFRQMATGAASQIAGLIIIATPTGALSHFDDVGNISIIASVFTLILTTWIFQKTPTA